MATERPTRVYNRDRIARIKEAARLLRGDVLNEEEEKMIDEKQEKEEDGRRTPEFLRQHSPKTSEVPRKLTVNELINSSKDSSQLADVMGVNNHGTDHVYNTWLDESRKNKMMVREQTNRKVADTLEKASEKWHTHIKEFNRNDAALDSSGVKSSLFNDNEHLIEDFEKENSEKLYRTKRYGTDFSGRLDILLQRGLRNKGFSRSSTNLRSLDERSHNRWSSKLDRISSVWDLKYSSLHNRTNSNVHMNHYSPSIPIDLGTRSSRNFSNACVPCSNSNLQYAPFNHPSNFPPTAFNNSLNSMYYSNPPQNFLNPFLKTNNNYLNSNSPISSQINPYILQVPSAFQTPQPILPFQNQQPNCSTVQQYNHQVPFVNTSPSIHSTNSMCHSCNYEHFNTIDTSNIAISNSFDCFSKKIADLTEKLGTLNNVIDELKINKTSNIKPIIKKYQIAADRNFENICQLSESQLEKRKQSNEKRNRTITIRTVSSNDRRIKFQSPERYCTNRNIQSVENTDFPSGDGFGVEKSARMHDSEYYQKNKMFKTFALPAEVTSVMMSHSKRTVHEYFRERK